MLFLLQPIHQDSVYEVLSVSRKETSAFRLGNRVDDTLVVSRDGKKYEIHLSPQHTHFGAVKLYAAGDKVTIAKKNLHDGDSVSRESIHLSK
ncbi:MAG: hypothetical protein JST12_17665 [Armatimonadetes bacterium]|nr:hypothetical protein [Armatimonadota bacterium]MBS1703496.1 hypothetical protein [Armatimonadota bacterium]MBS1727241.1 hypothetical protein [Armatimonadota bacterium]